MNPIPLDAMPVVEILRRDVPRPKEFPGMYCGVARWRSIDGDEPYDACPMGLHPKSTLEVPGLSDDFAGGACTTWQVQSFYRWWDEIKALDIPEAMDAIWPPNGGE